jgi:hypothetical protein
VTEWQGVFLALMAVALVVIAVVQVGLIVVALRLSRQVTTTVEELRREVRPLIDKANRLAEDAARTTSLALAQVERVDRFLALTTTRVDEVLKVLQVSLAGPVRQGAAFMMGLRTVISAIRQWQDRSAARREEDDALFVG